MSSSRSRSRLEIKQGCKSLSPSWKMMFWAAAVMFVFASAPFTSAVKSLSVTSSISRRISTRNHLRGQQQQQEEERRVKEETKADDDGLEDVMSIVDTVVGNEIVDEQEEGEDLIDDTDVPQIESVVKSIIKEAKTEEIQENIQSPPAPVNASQVQSLTQKVIALEKTLDQTSASSSSSTAAANVTTTNATLDTDDSIPPLEFTSSETPLQNTTDLPDDDALQQLEQSTYESSNTSIPDDDVIKQLEQMEIEETTPQTNSTNQTATNQPSFESNTTSTAAAAANTNATAITSTATKTDNTTATEPTAIITSDSPTAAPSIPVTDTEITSTAAPSPSPTQAATDPPTIQPTVAQVVAVTDPPTTAEPTTAPTTLNPTLLPTSDPTKSPSKQPTKSPTKQPTVSPTKRPTKLPTNSPTIDMDEVEHEAEEKVVKKVGGWVIFSALLGMIFTAHQVSENPDGVFASICRLAITISTCILKFLLLPCKKMFGNRFLGGYTHHHLVATDYRDPYIGRNHHFELS